MPTPTLTATATRTKGTTALETKATGKIEHKIVEATSVEMKDGASDGPGSMRMHFSTFGNWDRVRPVPERPRKGAFKEYLPQFIKSGFSAVNHNGEALPIGTISDAGEDSEGAWADVEFHSTTAAQDARTVIKERLARQKSVGVSFTYIVHDHDYVEMDDPQLKAQGISRGRELVKIETIEVGPVNIPANPKADVTGVKALEEGEVFAASVKGQIQGLSIKGMFEDELKERTNNLWSLMDVLACVLRRIQRLDEMAEAAGMSFDVVGESQAAFDEFTARGMASIVEEDQEEDSGTELSVPDYYDEYGYMSMRDWAEGVSLGDGLRLQRHLQVVVDAAQKVVARAVARKELRSKDGRVLSSETRTRIQKLHDSAAQIVAEAVQLLQETEPAPKADITAQAKSLDLSFLLADAAVRLANVGR